MTVEATDLPDGIHFDLDEATYHGLPRLSASGICKMLISPATFWAQSWLNPDRPEGAESAWRDIGRAYHCARFDPEKLAERFVRDLVKEDMPEGALLTDAEIKDALKELGEAQTKQGETVLMRAARLRLAQRAAGVDQSPVWHLERDIFEEENKDRVAITPKAWAEIEVDAKRLRQNPEIAEHLSGGIGEVSVLWTDEASGVKMKARIDYLKPASFSDFKTYDNTRGIQFDQIVPNAFRFNRYYVQAVLYWQAAELIRAGSVAIEGEATEAQRQLVEAIRANPRPMRVWYVFQEKNGIPNLFAREFCIFIPHLSLEANASDDETAQRMADLYSDPTVIGRKGALHIQWAQRTFNQMREIYEDGTPWFPINAISRIEDSDFNANWLDGDW